MNNIAEALIIDNYSSPIQYGLQLTKQALFKRMETGAALLKELMGWAVAYAAEHSVSTKTIEVLKEFKHVYLCDSTVVALPDKLQKTFKGLGGTNAKVAVKIQEMFSLRERKFRNLELWAATGNGSNYTLIIADKLSCMDLVIFDLGYFCTIF